MFQFAGLSKYAGNLWEKLPFSNVTLWKNTCSNAKSPKNVIKAFINYSFRFYGFVKMKAKGHCFFTLSIVTQFPATLINNVGLTFSNFEIQFNFEISFSKSNIVNRYCSLTIYTIFWKGVDKEEKGNVLQCGFPIFCQCGRVDIVKKSNAK